MCDDELNDICPTAISAVLLRLFRLETECPCEFDVLGLLQWWVRKIEEPDEADGWIESNGGWRMYARHIHALVAANVPCMADAVAYDLGIESPMIPKPEVTISPDGTVSEIWTLEAHGRSIPPFGFEVWQPPLTLTKNYPCEDEDWLDLDEEMADFEQFVEA